MTEKPVRILTIDDEAAMRDTLVAYLEDSGFEMLEADNGLNGVHMIRQERPDLVLCDLRMPEMDGLEVLEVVGEEFPEMPVIIVSGMGALKDAIKALKLGAWDYVTKPIEDMAVLEHAVQKSLERVRLLRENREYREHLETVNHQLRQSLQKLEADETAGRRIQFQLLPEDGARFKEYHFSRRLLPSLYLSGDFVDYFLIDRRHLGFYMVDVSGHGVSSAFITVLLKSYMHRYLNLHRQDRESLILDPSGILKSLNRDLFRGQFGKYLTMFYGVIELDGGRMRYSNGGQFPFPILSGDGASRFIESKSLPVGLFEFADYRTHTLDLPSRCTLGLFSDGILEVLPQSNLKGRQSYLLWVMDQPRTSLDELLRRLDLDTARQMPDDVTVMLIERGY